MAITIEDYKHLCKLEKKINRYEFILFTIGVLMLIVSRVFVKDYQKLSACETQYAETTAKLEDFQKAKKGEKPSIEIQLSFEKLQTN